MSYATDHSAALEQVGDAGASVTFTKTDTTYTPASDTHSTETSTVVGKAVRVKGRARTYEALGLVESRAPTLFFCPTTYGDEPDIGATVVWGGKTYTVRDVEPIAPDGTVIACRVVVEK